MYRPFKLVLQQENYGFRIIRELKLEEQGQGGVQCLSGGSYEDQCGRWDNIESNIQVDHMFRGR